MGAAVIVGEYDVPAGGLLKAAVSGGGGAVLFLARETKRQGGRMALDDGMERQSAAIIDHNHFKFIGGEVEFG